MRFQWQKLTQYSQKTRIDGKEYFADAVVLGGWEICSASGRVLFYHESLTTAKAQFAKLMNAPMVDQPAQNVVTLTPRNCNKEDFEPFDPRTIEFPLTHYTPCELDEIALLRPSWERDQIAVGIKHGKIDTSLPYDELATAIAEYLEAFYHCGSIPFPQSIPVSPQERDYLLAHMAIHIDYDNHFTVLVYSDAERNQVFKHLDTFADKGEL